MKKGLAILILLTSLFDLGGYFLFFSGLKRDIRTGVRQEIERGLNDSELVMISVLAGDEARIDWIEPGREFRLNGEMYDVVRIRKEAGRTHFFCLKDEKEKDLIAAFEKSHDSRKDQDRKTVGSFHLYFFSGIRLVPVIFSGQEVSFPPYLNSYRSALNDIHSPPPERFPISLI